MGRGWGAGVAWLHAMNETQVTHTPRTSRSHAWLVPIRLNGNSSNARLTSSGLLSSTVLSVRDM